jgi:hypothetical protein
MPIEIRGLVVGHCIRSLCQAKRYAIAEQLSSEEHLSIFRRTIMTNINLFMVLAGGAAVAICAVLIQLCDLPLWLLPGVMALSGLIIAMCWGPMARRTAIILVIVAGCGFLGLMFGELYFLRVHGTMLPFSHEAVERRGAAEMRVGMTGAWLGASVGFVLVLTQGRLLRRDVS